MLKNVVGALALTVFVFVAINVVGDLAFPPHPTPMAKNIPADEPEAEAEETAEAPEASQEPQEPQEMAEAEPEAEPVAEPEPDAQPEAQPEAVTEAVSDAVEEAQAEPVAEPMADAVTEKVEEVEKIAAAASSAMGDAEKGQKIFRRKCMTCHSYIKGGRNLTGPNLWGVVGRNKGKVADFRYSETLALMGGTWSEDDILTFIASPRKFVTDTKMTFPGLKKEQDRLDVLAFLKSLTD